MTLRRQILVASTLLVLLPLALLGLVVRGATARRTADAYETRIASLNAVVQENLAARRLDLTQRLASLRLAAAADNAFALSAAGMREFDPYLLDFAEQAQRLTGLDVMRVLNAEGRVLAAGDDPSAAGESDRDLRATLAGAPGGAGLVTFGDGLVLAQVDSLFAGGRRLYLIGGVDVDGDFLSRLAGDRDVAVTLVYHGGALSTDPELAERLQSAGRDRLDQPELALPAGDFLVRALDFPHPVGRFVSRTADPRPAPPGLIPARLLLTHPRAPLLRMRRDLDAWLLALFAATAAGTLVLAAWLSGRLSRPLRSLARRAEALDLDRLDGGFDEAAAVGGEVGTLARLLDTMAERLRAGVLRLREAERRATRGDLARQVNHDIRNGFTPIRNVVRHLAQVAREEPAALPAVFAEREGTLESGLSYLEELADSYARLSPRAAARPCDLNAEVRAATRELDPAADRIALDLAADPPRLRADPVGLRRVVQNLVRNGLDSLPADGGRVVVATRAADGDDGPEVVLEVRDDGRGMDEAVRARIFEPFFTTRDEGSGLGLAVVRRLVADWGGRIDVASAPGRGATFTLSFPAADVAADGAAAEEPRP